EALEARLINRVAPKATYLDVARALADEVNKNPPLSVRATVRTRRWYLEQLTREINMQTQPLKLYLSEDFNEAARAFAEKRNPGAFKAAGAGLARGRRPARGSGGRRLRRGVAAKSAVLRRTAPPARRSVAEVNPSCLWLTSALAGHLISRQAPR